MNEQGHKFRVGERVRLLRDPLNRTTEIYEVLALLPEIQQGWQYRIQHPRSRQQRIAPESVLEQVEPKG